MLCESEDVVGVLFDDGSIVLWDLRCRLVPGQQKEMDPLVLFCGSFIASERSVFRQLHIYSTLEKHFDVAILSSTAQTDQIFYASIHDGHIANTRTKTMPSLGGRLAHSTEGIFWQAKEGTLYEG